MSIFKRGGIYWYKFMWNGKLIRESTKQGNDRKARNIESAHRARLSGQEDARKDACLRLNCSQVLLCDECQKWFNAEDARRDGGHVVCSDSCDLAWTKRHTRVPTLAEFCRMRFAPWAESTSSLKTWRDFYRVGVMAIQAYGPLASQRLNAITTEGIADFAGHRQAQGKQVTTVNASLRILRRILRVAQEWGEIEKVPKVRMLPGESHRERVIMPGEEARYLASASSLLSEIATVLVDTGLRPEECYRLVWDSITWVNGRNGTLLVTHGKTKAARRLLPMTPRVRHILETRWKAAGRPLEGYVWPAPTQTGHIEPSSLKKQHSKALELSKVRPFVLYSLRHTFLTRLGESGCDVWTLARIAGHSSIGISARYVHPSEDAVLQAMTRLGGHNSGHRARLRAKGKSGEMQLTA